MAIQNKSKSTSSRAKAKPPARKPRDRALWSASLFAVGVLTFAFALVKGESAWNFIHSVLRGMFGGAVFAVPVILIYVSVLIALDKSGKAIESKIIQGFALVLLFSGFIQIVFIGEFEGERLFAEIIPALYNNGKELSGGGVFSVILAYPLLMLFKKTGASIIITLLVFVLAMVLSNKTIIDLFHFIKNRIKSREYDDDGYDGDEAEEPEKPKVKAAPPPKIAKKTSLEKPKEPAAKNTAALKPEKMPAEHVNSTPPFEPDFFSDSKLPPPAAKSPASPSEEKTATEELNSLIKKAANAPKKITKAAASNHPETSKALHSTLASNKIKTEQDFDLPDAPTAADIQIEIAGLKNQAVVYNYPPISLLNPADNSSFAADAEAEMKQNADTLVDTLKSFGVQTRIVDIHRGPTVTRYEIQPSAGVKVSKITGLENDIALNLAAAGVRIEAPIPGKAAVGVEIPNKVKDMVSIRELLESAEFAENKSKLSFVVGRNIDGDVIIGDIGKMPHVIIAGTTGSGKSVCTNSIIMSILYNSSPDDVRLVLIDPKMVEFKTYDGIPHLLIPVVIDPRKAAGALAWAVQEMLKRYKLFSDCNVRDLQGYNEMAAQKGDMELLPRIVIAIDELADLMMAAAKEVEESICRLAQMARAAGMHLIIATQRPTVDVITGLIKANIPSRIALTVSSQIDSRTIIDTAGAEKLLGQGDMLYYPSGIPKPIRIQGCFCSTKEVEKVVEYIKGDGVASYDNEIIEEIEKNLPAPKSESSSGGESSEPTGDGDIIDQAVDILVSGGQASVSFLQRRLKLGYARAARIMDELEEMGVVGPHEGAKPRQVLINREMWLQRKMSD
ncbi:MAG: DNA translocase FtsK [Oscillospiraceae bacterium]|nr:DNA translocase FtsK [Oscillospiraceae bacterium]